MESTKKFYVRFCISDLMLAVPVEQFCRVMPMDKKMEEQFSGNCQEMEYLYRGQSLMLYDLRGYVLRNYCLTDRQRVTILVLKTKTGEAGYIIDHVFSVEDFGDYTVCSTPNILKHGKGKCIEQIYSNDAAGQLIYELDMEQMTQMWKEENKMRENLLDEAEIPLREILREIGNVGVGKATSVLSKMIGFRLLIDVPEVIMADEINDSPIFSQNEDAVEVTLQFENDMDGRMVFLLKESFIEKALAKMLRKQKDQIKNLHANEEAMSLITEMANVMTGAYLSALSVYTDTRMYISFVETKNGKIKDLVDYTMQYLDLFRESVCVKGKFFLVNQGESDQQEIDQEYNEVEGQILMFPQKAMLNKIVECFGLE